MSKTLIQELNDGPVMLPRRHGGVHDGFQSLHVDRFATAAIMTCAAKEIERLRAVVAKSPKTADGVVIQYRDHVYVPCDIAGYYNQGHGKAVRFLVESIKGQATLLTTSGPDDDVRYFYRWECYSTSEAAESAILAEAKGTS